MALLEWLVLQENLDGWKKGHRQRTTLSLYSPLLRVPCALRSLLGHIPNDLFDPETTLFA